MIAADERPRRAQTRVLHVLKTSGIGGAERHLLTLLPGLAARGLDLRVLVATTGDAWRFVDALSSSGIDVRTTPAGPDANPLLYRRIRQEILDFRPALVHTHLIHADAHGQIAAARLGVPTVSSMHSAHRFYHRLPYGPVCRYVGHKAWRTIAISGFVRDFAIEHRLNDPDSIRVVHYGISLQEWDSLDADPQAAEGLPASRDGSVTFGIASRLIRGKGHSLVIDSFAEAHDRIPAAQLLIAGDGPLRHELKDRVRQRRTDAIRFLGFVPDVKSFLEACDVLVVPTQAALGEGFGLVALEGMASSRPVIATTVGALPEVVADEDTGILVSPTGTTELTAAIERLAGNPGERVAMGERGRRRAAERFTAERMVEATVDVYAELAPELPL